MHACDACMHTCVHAHTNARMHAHMTRVQTDVRAYIRTHVARASQTGRKRQLRWRPRSRTMILPTILLFPGPKRVGTLVSPLVSSLCLLRELGQRRLVKGGWYARVSSLPPARAQFAPRRRHGPERENPNLRKPQRPWCTVFPARWRGGAQTVLRRTAGVGAGGVAHIYKNCLGDASF